MNNLKTVGEPENNGAPLISVITVAFNAEKYIEQCIQSVIDQSYDNFEYVIIDGDSTDATKNIIKKYQDKLSYWHSKKDRGLAHAFNEGISHSLGKWLLFLNSDDFFVNLNVLEKMSAPLSMNGKADVVFGQVILSRDISPKKIGGPYGAPFRWKQFLMRDTIPHQAAFTNRSLFEEEGLFDERFKIAVDYEHYIRAGSKLNAVYNPTLVAFMRDGGLSQENIIQTLKELHKARSVNKVLPKIVTLAIHFWIYSRTFLGIYVKSCLKIYKNINKQQK